MSDWAYMVCVLSMVGAVAVSLWEGEIGRAIFLLCGGIVMLGMSGESGGDRDD